MIFVLIMEKRSDLIIILALIASLLSGTIFGQSILKGPYLLYDDDNTRMEILWQDDSTSTDTLSWWADSDSTSGFAAVPGFGLDYQHRLIINGLFPGTKYSYKLSVGSNDYSGTFYTAPPAGQHSLQFFAYGDSRTGVVNHNRLAGLINECWTNQPEYQSFILSMGDLVTNGNKESYWASDLFNAGYPDIGRMMANLPLLACRGNHEGNAILFGKYFPYPYIGKYYYSVDYGPAHIIFIDIYTPIKPGSEQYNWLVNDLAGSASRWKFVCVHEPGWSAGAHPNNALVQDIIEPLCEEFNVAVLFAGHNHYYARAIVKNNDGDSVIHITTGGGGGPLYTPEPGMENVMIASKNWHFCKINIVNDDLLLFEAISDSGKVIDLFSIDRKPATIVDRNLVQFFEIFPNPLKDQASVEFTLSGAAVVKMTVFNLEGDDVKVLLPDTRCTQGKHKLAFDGSKLPGGVYLCKMIIKDDYGKMETVCRKVLIAR